MKTLIIAFTTVFLMVLSQAAWPASTKEEIIELKAQVTEMQKDLAEIKKLLEEGARAPARGAPAGFKEQTVSIDDSPFKGSEDAPVTIIEYSDYQCPYCARNYREVLPLITKQYIDTGKVKFVMREYPLPTLHKNAMAMSSAALCAGNQGKYWEMHNLLFENQKKGDDESLKAHAASLQLDTQAFNDCLTSKETADQVRTDMASGAKLGMSGTPGFFIGATDPKDPNKANLSVFIRGAQSIEQFQASIDELLKTAAK